MVILNVAEEIKRPCSSNTLNWLRLPRLLQLNESVGRFCEGIL